MPLIRLNKGTVSAGQLCGCNDSSCMAPALPPFSTKAIRRTGVSSAGRLTVSALRSITGRALCVHSCESMVIPSPRVLIWHGCAWLSFGKHLNAEERPVLDMPLAEKAESSTLIWEITVPIVSPAVRPAPVASLLQHRICGRHAKPRGEAGRAFRSQLILLQQVSSLRLRRR